jgi:hypothetical protein
MKTLDIEALLALHRSLFGDARMETTADVEEDEKSDDATTTDDEATDEDKAAEEKAAAEALGDAGKQALDRMKARWQKERDRRTAAEAALAEKDRGADDKPDADKIRAEADQAAMAKVNERILRSEIRAAAAGKFQDPKDALAYLDLSKFEVDDDGNVDEDEITEALTDLLAKKPYLGVTKGDKKFKGTADAGARGNAGKPQLTEADVKQLAAQGKHAEIEQARVDGRLNTLLGIT